MIAPHGIATVLTVEHLKLINMIADHGIATVLTVEHLKLINMIAPHGKATLLPQIKRFCCKERIS